jgi:hypothetical protein
MSTQNEVSNPQNPLPGADVEPLAFDRQGARAESALSVGPLEEPARSNAVTQRGGDNPQNGQNGTQKAGRVKTKKGHNEAHTKTLDPIAPASKPVRAKRAKTQSAEGVNDQAEVVSKPKRTLAKRTNKVADSLSPVAPAGNDIPPITPAAIEFLGKQEATVADVLKLSPDSLAFVQYHFKQMQQLEADSRLINAYLVANSRPASPAFQLFADALAKRGGRDQGHAAAQATREDSEPRKQQPANVAIPSYRQTITTYQTYLPIVVRLRTLDLMAGTAPTHVQNSQLRQDDDNRAHSMLEEAQARFGPKVLNGLENSIERSPVQLVTAAQQDSAAPPATAAQQSATAENSAEQPAASAAPSEKNRPGPVPRSGLVRRLGLAFGAMANWARSWLLSPDKDGTAHAAGAQVFLHKAADIQAAIDDRSGVVPESVARRFLKVGREYYFQDRTPAFSDRGNRLATRGIDPEVIRSLVEIAKARGWDTITVKGSDDFRRSTWLEATQKGMTVAGYKPTALDLADLENRPANNAVEKGAIQEKNSMPKSPRTQQPAAQANFAQTATPTHAPPKAPVPTVLRPDPEWTAKAKAFQEDKPASVVKKYPDLAAAYGIVSAAKAFAAEKLPETAREEFVSMAQRHMVEKIQAGKHIQGPKIYSVSTKTNDFGNQIGAVEENVAQDKSPREKAIGREQ